MYLFSLKHNNSVLYWLWVIITNEQMYEVETHEETDLKSNRELKCEWFKPNSVLSIL